jgi:hypothetical protein
VNSEDQLLAFLLEFGSRRLSLLRYVDCAFLSLDGIRTFVSVVSPLDIDQALWLSISRRLVHRITDVVASPNRFVRTSSVEPFEWRPEAPFGGILAHLTVIGGGNVHLKGMVRVSSSGDCCGKCFEVTNFGWKGHFYTANRPNSWIQFDFNPRQVALTDYTLKSDLSKGYHLLHWKLEGSHDGKNWVVRDKRGTQDLNGMSIVKSYRCIPEQTPTFFRYIRLTQTGENASGENDLFLCNIEFFGMLESPNE